jgi:hypothetical protein
MIRAITVSLMFLAAAILVDVAPAQPISRYNPYRSFNVTGVNYASMQWERSHRRTANSSWHSRRVFSHRR